MKQILHIFVKDVRQFWGEIFLSVAITAAFVWYFPYQWTGADRMHAVMGNHLLVPYTAQFLGSILIYLVPGSWWLFVTRVVHSERLVGDRQFWLTRPYEWKNLLSAKLLFVLVFLYLPIFAAQCMLLAEAGFQPFSYIPGLLYSLFLLTVVIVLPIFALATVTSNFARMTLTLLAAVVGVLCLGSFSSRLLPRHPVVAGLPESAVFSYSILLCAGIAAVLIQYSRRKVWIARILVFGTPALFIMAAPVLARLSNDQALIDRHYPTLANQDAAPVKLSVFPFSPGEREFVTNMMQGEIFVHIPLKGTGVADGYAVIPDNVRFAFETPDGYQWVSPWQPSSTPTFLPIGSAGDSAIFMPRAVYDRLIGKPITVHLTLAVTQAKVSNVSRIPISIHDFSVPDFGVCSPVSGFRTPIDEATGIVCRSALRQPPLTYIGVVWSNTSCSTPHTEPDPGVQGAGWAGSLDRAPAQFGISSVRQTNFQLSNGYPNYPSGNPRYLCPGSPVTFTQYDVFRRTQVALTIQGFQLAAVRNSWPSD